MALIVQKFGGTSVANTERIFNVADIVTKTAQAGNQVVVVVSAQGDTTDDFIEKAAEITDNPPAREMDVLLSAGEQISMALLAMAINKLGFHATSLTGWQAGIKTDLNYGSSRIRTVRPERIQSLLDRNRIVIVAGFQGINEDGDATTLGRGGSDTSAVALAVALGADVCEIYTDVDGVFTADPRIVPTARRIPVIDYESMLEMSSCGSKVLALRCVEYAQRFGMPLHVRSSFSHRNGTLILPEGVSPASVPNLTRK